MKNKKGGENCKNLKINDLKNKKNNINLNSCLNLNSEYIKSNENEKILNNFISINKKNEYIKYKLIANKLIDSGATAYFLKSNNYGIRLRKTTGIELYEENEMNDPVAENIMHKKLNNLLKNDKECSNSICKIYDYGTVNIGKTEFRYSILELGYMNLNDFLNKYKINLKLFCFIIKLLIIKIKCIHNHNIIHLDIKPHNIIICKGDENNFDLDLDKYIKNNNLGRYIIIKYIDFGISKEMEIKRFNHYVPQKNSNYSNEMFLTSSIEGSWNYIPKKIPVEVIINNKIHTSKFSNSMHTNNFQKILEKYKQDHNNNYSTILKEKRFSILKRLNRINDLYSICKIFESYFYDLEIINKIIQHGVESTYNNVNIKKESGIIDYINKIYITSTENNEFKNNIQMFIKDLFIDEKLSKINIFVGKRVNKNNCYSLLINKLNQIITTMNIKEQYTNQRIKNFLHRGSPFRTMPTIPKKLLKRNYLKIN